MGDKMKDFDPLQMGRPLSFHGKATSYHSTSFSLTHKGNFSIVFSIKTTSYYIRALSRVADSLQLIQGASDDGNVLFHHVGIDLGSFHICMPHQFLNDPNVNPVFKQVRGPAFRGGINCTMPKGMTANRFCKSRLSYGGLHRFLEPGFKHVMTSGFTWAGVCAVCFWGEHILPAEGFGGIGI